MDKDKPEHCGPHSDSPIFKIFVFQYKQLSNMSEIDVNLQGKAKG